MMQLLLGHISVNYNNVAYYGWKQMKSTATIGMFENIVNMPNLCKIKMYWHDSYIEHAGLILS